MTVRSCETETPTNTNVKRRLLLLLPLNLLLTTLPIDERGSQTRAKRSSEVQRRGAGFAPPRRSRQKQQTGWILEVKFGPVCLLPTAAPPAPLKLKVKVVFVSAERCQSTASLLEILNYPFSLFNSHKVHDRAKKKTRLKAYFVALQPGGTL